MKVQKLEKYENKSGIMGCKRSSFNAPDNAISLPLDYPLNFFFRFSICGPDGSGLAKSTAFDAGKHRYPFLRFGPLKKAVPFSEILYFKYATFYSELG